MSPPAKPRSQPQSPRSGGSDTSFQVLFDPTAPEVKLFDELAEKQAELLPAINSNQLRKYFGEIKDLYRQFEARSAGEEEHPNRVYMEAIEPRFKMIRSKVAYGQRKSSQGSVPPEFARFLSEGIQSVRPGQYEEFRKFVMHLEAVVGFMYGNGKVK